MPYTKQECFDAVRLKFPNANGVTTSEPCPNECKCYAEFGMTGWNSEKGWLSCMFSKGCKYTKRRYHSRFLWNLTKKNYEHVVPNKRVRSNSKGSALISLYVLQFLYNLLSLLLSIL